MQTKNKRQRSWGIYRIFFLVVFILLLLVVGIAIRTAITQTFGENEVDEEEIFQYATQPRIGSEQAPIRIVEFGDFKCPPCRFFGEEIFPLLKEEFIDPGHVQFFYLHYPVVSPNQDSKTAALAAEAVHKQNPEQFWPFYKAVLAHQQEPSQTWATANHLIEIAKSVPLDIDFEQLKIDMEQESLIAEVDKDVMIGREMDVNGTPSLFINGKKLTDNEVMDYEQLRKKIEKELDQQS